MRGVEQAQFHELVGHHVGHHLHADVLEGRAPVGEAVLQNPLREGLAHHRPRVLHAQALADGLDVRGRRLRGDAVDHAVGEGDIVVDPLREDRVAHPRLRHDGRARHLPVAGQVVAAHHRERGDAGVAAPAQGLHDVAETGRRVVRIGGVAGGALGLRAE